MSKESISKDQFDRTDEWAHGAHLFDPAPFDTPKAERDTASMHPGDLTHDEWMQRPDVVFHGTFRNTDPDSPVAPVTFHAGTRQSAQERMQRLSRLMGLPADAMRTRKPAPNETTTVGGRNPRISGKDEEVAAGYAGMMEPASSYWYDPEDDVFDESGRVDDRKAMAHFVNNNLQHGKIVGRRIDDTFPAKLSDQHANTADMEYMIEHGQDVPGSIQGSAHEDGESFSLAEGRLGLKDVTESEYERLHPVHGLYRGTSLPYRNKGEDEGSISYVVPKGESTGYWDDVIASPNRSPEEKARAEQMRSELGSPPVPFEINVGNQTPQGSLFREYSRMGGTTALYEEPNFDQENRDASRMKEVTYIARPTIDPSTDLVKKAKVGRGGVRKEPPLKGKISPDEDQFL